MFKQKKTFDLTLALQIKQSKYEDLISVASALVEICKENRTEVGRLQTSDWANVLHLVAEKICSKK